MKISDEFHKYYDKHTLWHTTTWMGVPCWKLPFDAWVLQELIFKYNPQYIIETGTAYGGSALFYASILDTMGAVGHVITIDIDDSARKSIDYNYRAKRLWRERVTAIKGSSIDPDIVDQVSTFSTGRMVSPRNSKCIVILDSWHSEEHVTKELELYSPLVKPEGYLIVEDTHVNGNPIEWEWGGGPKEAVYKFLETTDDFEIDKRCEKFIMTFNPDGFLRRVK